MRLILLFMKIGYSLLCLSVIFVCIWFMQITVKRSSYYATVFKFIMWSAVVFYVVRIVEQTLEYSSYDIPDNVIFAGRALHFMLLGQIYGLFAYLIISIVHHIHYYKPWQKIAMFSPILAMYVLIITSQRTRLIFYVEDGVFYHGRFVWVMIAIRITYGVYAFIRGYAKRHLMPVIFGRGLELIFLFSVAYGMIYVMVGDDTLEYSVLIINVVITQLILSVVEFHKDPTTEMFNNIAFKEYINTHISNKNNKAVYLIKLKNYDYIKESCHETYMTEIIQFVSDSIKQSSLLSSMYYLGNGRFVLIACKNDKFDERDFFDKMRMKLSEPFQVNGSMLHIGLFVAVMNMNIGNITKDNFKKYFDACDSMRYQTDESIEVIQGDSFNIAQLQRYHNVEEAIDRALAEKEFIMYYQPIVSSETGKIVSAEALIRLNDRVLGFVSPEEFIPISESNGRIIEISEFVIDSVFKFVKTNDLESMGLQFIEMNLSAVQCMDNNLIDKLRNYIEKYDVDPKYINLEITETATNFDENRLKEQLKKLRKLGFLFSLDDYGTGYSNLVRVLEYPVDIIKLDKSIVWSAFTDEDNFVTIKNLISMFHDVRRQLVAEGVENEEQRDTLVEIGCDYLQGYYYSKPIPEDEFIIFAKKHNSELN